MPAAAPPAVALPHNQAVLAAANDLLSKAQLPTGTKYSIVINSQVAGVTGIQTLATDSMERPVVQIVKNDFPQYEIKPFSSVRLKCQGYGSRQSLIGTGKNDASDALDQRIAFKPTSC